MLNLSQNFFHTVNEYFDNDVEIVRDGAVFRPIDIDLTQTTKNNLLILTVDHWGDDEFLLTPDSANLISPIDKLRALSQQIPDKQIYVTTTCPFLCEYFADCDNVKIIYWNPEFVMNPNTCYHGLDPVVDKKFDKPWHWLCLNNNTRMHRNIANLLILGDNVTNGFVKFDPKPLLGHESWPSFLWYLEFNNYTYLQSQAEKIYPILEKGFSRLKNHDGFVWHDYDHDPGAGPTIDLHAGRNFDKHLRTFYSSSVVEIINETTFISRTGIINEKYLNSVYGLNFPIMIGMSGIVKHLRQLGFDMFDDVVDHSHDDIKDHYARMMAAIQRNRRLLEDRQFALSSWTACQDRFRANIDLTEYLYNNKESLALEKISQALDD
jgi:hypothetical protein